MFTLGVLAFFTITALIIGGLLGFFISCLLMVKVADESDPEYEEELINYCDIY